MKPQEVKAIAQSLFGEHRNPFGAFSLGSETHQPVTVPDAVRRARWIAVDLNATEFSLFVVGPSTQRSFLVPGFDSAYPGISPSTKLMSGDRGEAIVKHARVSTLPCWWTSGPPTASSEAFARIGWSIRVPPLIAETSGIAFPVYADQDRSGLVAFLGPDIALDMESIHEIHARCFTLFAAFARIKPGEKAKFPAISKREIECLKLTANGYTSEDIARTLKLSVHTANQYLSNTTQKLDAVNRMHAVAKALRLGLIE